VFFAKSDSVFVNQSVISFLRDFSQITGNKTPRRCMDQDQSQLIQEMLMIHSEPISTRPLRQDNNYSVSYYMIWEVIEITLHHGGMDGGEVYTIEDVVSDPNTNSSIRVPARFFRTIRTLTSSAVFIEVQSGPFKDSNT